MGYHTFDASGADRLEQAGQRYRFLSAEELVWGLDLSPAETVADLGSGTGFYTDDVAPARGHGVRRRRPGRDARLLPRKGVPQNVELLTTEVGDLPFDAGSVDAAFSTMTYHEFASDDALAEVHRVLRADGRLVVVDWAATGSGEHGPPLDERFTATEAAATLRANGFRIEHEAVRPETFYLVATVE